MTEILFIISKLIKIRLTNDAGNDAISDDDIERYNNQKTEVRNYTSFYDDSQEDFFADTKSKV